MTPLRVTAHLRGSFAAADPWSPTLDGILGYWVMRERLGEEEFAIGGSGHAPMSPVDGLPMLMQDDGEGRTWWACSSPLATVEGQFLRYYHRRFNSVEAERYLAGGVKAPATTAGAYKDARLTRQVRVARAVTWHCIGDAAEIERLLRRCRQIGDGIASGHGVVERWEVTPDGADARTAMLHRPLPVAYADARGLSGPRMRWGLRAPARLTEVQAECIMPAPAEGQAA